MVLLMQFLHTFAGDVGIDLRRGKIAVTEQHLHHTQIGAVIQQMRGKGVAQGVRSRSTPALRA